MIDRIAADFDRAIKFAKRSKRTRPPLTEKVQGLLHALHHPNYLHLQPILADALEEDGLVDATDLQPLREDPTRFRYLHEFPDRYRIFPDPKLTISDIRRINREHDGNFFSPATMRFWNSRPERQVHQGPHGTYFVDATDNFDRTQREYKVNRFDPKTGRATRYIEHPTLPGIATTWFPTLATAEEAHRLAAHLAEYGRLPTQQEEHERLMGQSE